MTPPRIYACLLALAALGFIALTPLDEPIYKAIDPSLASREHLDGELWYLVLRHTGSAWAWLAVAAVCIVHDRVRRKQTSGQPFWLRGVFVALGAAAGGLGTELAKLVIARERPATIQTLENGAEALVYQGYQFRGLFSGFLDGSNLGLPSSHAGTAAGGALALTLLLPKLGWVVIPLAIGCGVSRLLTGAHFATDVYTGFIMASILVLLLRRSLRPVPPNAGPNDPAHTEPAPKADTA